MTDETTVLPPDVVAQAKELLPKLAAAIRDHFQSQSLRLGQRAEKHVLAVAIYTLATMDKDVKRIVHRLFAEEPS